LNKLKDRQGRFGRGMSDKDSMSYQDALDMLVKQRTDG